MSWQHTLCNMFHDRFYGTANDNDNFKDNEIIFKDNEDNFFGLMLVTEILVSFTVGW